MKIKITLLSHLVVSSLLFKNVLGTECGSFRLYSNEFLEIMKNANHECHPEIVLKKEEECRTLTENDGFFK
jgi:hypothetical protein